MAGLDYRLVARWFHDLFLLKGDPRYHINLRAFGFNTKSKLAILPDALRPKLASQGYSGVS
jgi:hypothetical protein